jgi:hypothetical protein
MRHSKILEKHNIEMILQLKTKFSPFQNDISRIRNILVYKIKGRKMTTKIITAECHNCEFDYQAKGQRDLSNSLVKVRADKVNVI